MCNVYLPYIKHALNVRHKTYVKCIRDIAEIQVNFTKLTFLFSLMKDKTHDEK